jgi:hypothetical protein
MNKTGVNPYAGRPIPPGVTPTPATGVILGVRHTRSSAGTLAERAINMASLRF